MLSNQPKQAKPAPTATSTSTSTAKDSQKQQSNAPVRTAIVQDGRKKFHTTFPDGAELIEEFDLASDDLVVRRYRKKNMLGKEQDWVYEIGEAPRPQKMQTIMSEVQITESELNPVVCRRDTKDYFMFRIRNLPYPKNVYALSIQENKIVVRTSNKKYFTRIAIPDMDRAKLQLEPSSLAYDHGGSTLVIRYKKPSAILAKEAADREEHSKIKTDGGRDGDVDCKTQ